MRLTQYHKEVLRLLVCLVLTIALCRVTRGAFCLVVALLGAYFATQRKAGYMAACFMTLPMLTVLSDILTGWGRVLVLGSRVGSILIAFAAIPLLEHGQTKRRLPFGWLFGYLFVTVLSSLDGWCPVISYLKIVNYFLFLIALCCILRAMQGSDSDLATLRAMFMAFALFFILGSAVTRFIPSVGYSMQLHKLAMWNVEMTGEQLLESEGHLLFSGVCNHSQTLGVITPLACGWVLCDMLFIERRFDLMHLVTMLVAFVIMFMTRSRTALLAFVVMAGIVSVYGLPRARLSPALKARLRTGFFALGVLAVIGMGVMEARNKTLSRWLRKIDNIEATDQTWGESLTTTRMGIIRYNLNDFRLNPLLGKGFQVMRWHRDALREGWITYFSASCEKGVLPTVILGESGLFGTLFFILFLGCFYATCIGKRYMATLSLFTAFLATNLGECTFFSPGGNGTTLWMWSVVGGFCLDLIVARRVQNENAFDRFFVMPLGDIRPETPHPHKNRRTHKRRP